MDLKTENDSSSSEDEICLEAIKEAADQDLFTNSLFQPEGNKSKTPNSKIALEEIDSNQDEYATHGLSQSCRDFIAKKLIEKLNIDIIIEDVDLPSVNKKNNSQETLGIKLFNSSKAEITNIDNNDEQEKTFRKRVLPKFDEKQNLARCKEVALDSQTILSQHELKHWVNRKPSQEFKYKKCKNGTLLQIT